MEDEFKLGFGQILVNNVLTNCVSVINFLLSVRFFRLVIPTDNLLAKARSLVTGAWCNTYKGRAGLEQVLISKLSSGGKATPVLTSYQQVTTLLGLLPDKSECLSLAEATSVLSRANTSRDSVL